MSDESPLPEPPTLAELLDASGAIAADVPCVECRYLLRGLRPDGECPECGEPIGRSLHAHARRLMVGDPRWLEQVNRAGVWYLLVGVCPIVLVRGDIPELAIGFSTMVALFVAGIWQETRREPHAAERRLMTHLRWWSRGLALGWLVASVIGSTVFAVDLSRGVIATRQDLCIAAVSMLTCLVPAAHASYLRMLAKRIRSEMLTSFLTAIMTGWGLLAASFAVAWLTYAFAGAMGLLASVIWSAVMVCGLGLCALGSIIAAVWLRVRLANAAKAARQI